ncbi:hypothetical protein MLD52_22720 [Puniceicoccaceae bacterium K14]|nr:hypothetical protein [Puniceicoccaceae bacterium K14]
MFISKGFCSPFWFTGRSFQEFENVFGSKINKLTSSQYRSTITLFDKQFELIVAKGESAIELESYVLMSTFKRFDYYIDFLDIVSSRLEKEGFTLERTDVFLAGVNINDSMLPSHVASRNYIGKAYRNSEVRVYILLRAEGEIDQNLEENDVVFEMRFTSRVFD